MLYWYGLLPALILQVFTPKFADKYLVGGCYLVLGLLLLVVPKLIKKK